MFIFREVTIRAKRGAWWVGAVAAGALGAGVMLGAAPAWGQSATPPAAGKAPLPTPPTGTVVPPGTATAAPGPGAVVGGVVGGSPGTTDFPGLRAALAAARERAPAVVAARASVGVARASYVGARLLPIGNPYMEVVTDRGSQGVTRGLTMTATMWLPLEPWGQRGRRVAEADARVGWLGASSAYVQALAAAEVVRAYGTAVVEAERVKLLEQILETARAEAAVYRARVQAGDATEQDAAMAAVEVARNAVAMAESRADLIKAQADLARGLGLEAVGPPGAGVDLGLRPAKVAAGRSTGCWRRRPR